MAGLQEVEALLEEQRAQSKKSNEQLQRLEAEKQALLRNEQQTISLLVSEKSSLTAELQRLETVESGMAHYRYEFVF
jgi:myosin protein heavy chain